MAPGQTDKRGTANRGQPEKAQGMAVRDAESERKWPGSSLAHVITEGPNDIRQTFKCRSQVPRIADANERHTLVRLAAALSSSSSSGRPGGQADSRTGGQAPGR